MQGEVAWSGDAVLVYVDYSQLLELSVAGLVSIRKALFVDCLQGGRDVSLTAESFQFFDDIFVGQGDGDTHGRALT